MRILLVVNPAAGGADEERIARAADVLRVRGEVEVLPPGDAASFAGRVTTAATTAERVVVAGGDGTLNCTVNALAESIGTKTFALLPMGTGNDFARTLGIPEDDEVSLRVAIGDEVRKVDVGRACGRGVDRLFVNACMGGIAVQVDRAIDEGLKERLGPVAFWLGGARAAANLERFTTRINGIEVHDCVGVGIGSGRTCGGGFEVWPEARPDDGLLDACALGAPNVAAAARLLLKVRSGTHDEIDQVRSIAASRVEVEADPDIEINVDGELVGLATPATFEVVGQVSFLAPPVASGV